jgi:hypothetical protein
LPSRHEFVLENGTKFYIRRYDVFLAMKILGDVQKRFMTPFALFMESNDQKLSQEIRDRNLMAAIQQFSHNIDGDSLIQIAKTVLNAEYVSVSVGGNPPEKLTENVLNMATDSVVDVVALVMEVLKVNYEELFTRGKTLIGQAQAPVAATIQ